MRTRRIPNRLTAGIAAAGLGLWLQQLGAGGLVPWIVGLAVGGALLALPAILGGLGGGDVKLLAALGSVGGFAFALQAGFLTALAGGLLAAGVLLWRLIRDRAARGAARSVYPYGPAIALGAIVALVHAL